MSTLLIVILLLLLWGGGSGYYAHQQWGPQGATGIFAIMVFAIVIALLFRATIGRF